MSEDQSTPEELDPAKKLVESGKAANRQEAEAMLAKPKPDPVDEIEGADDIDEDVEGDEEDETE